MIKAKLQLKFGSLAAAASALQCSHSGLVAAANGKCPHILKRIEAATRDLEIVAA